MLGFYLQRFLILSESLGASKPPCKCINVTFRLEAIRQDQCIAFLKSQAFIGGGNDQPRVAQIPTVQIYFPEQQNLTRADCRHPAVSAPMKGRKLTTLSFYLDALMDPLGVFVASGFARPTDPQWRDMTKGVDHPTVDLQFPDFKPSVHKPHAMLPSFL
jgi:hypothetical protein